MRLYDIIAQTQPQARALSGGLGSEEGLENFFLDRFGHAVAIIAYPDLHFVPCFFGAYCNGGFISFQLLLFLFIDGIKGIGEKVQDYAANILGNGIDVADRGVEIGVQGGIEALVLGS